jgi:large subunit ribosomal protein L32
MASLAFRSTRNLFPTLSPFRSLFGTVSLGSWLLGTSFRWSFSPLDSLLELFPPFLLAVPKKKVSHSRKAMRSANKGLKDKQSARLNPNLTSQYCLFNFSLDIVHCSACGSPKLAHHLCPSCYSYISRRWKAQARSQGGSEGVVQHE